MNEKLISYIENSFLTNLLKDPEITDISFNGVSLFYMHNMRGRKKADFDVSVEEVTNFVRQIANLSERQFSFSSPNLNISVGRYRINAVHSSIVRVKDEKSVSFAIRIASSKLRIRNDGTFMSKEMNDFLLDALSKGKSIVIGGEVGSGKTELQKYLISKMKDFTRVIIIDDVQELDYLERSPNLDVTCWQIQPNNPNATINELVRVALRSNPDWLIVAESRGKEMNDLINSVMTGHPIITTMHVKALEHMPVRMARMAEINEISETHEQLLEDIYDHFDVFVYVEREFMKNGAIKRYISSIGTSEKGKIKKIFERKKS